MTCHKCVPDVAEVKPRLPPEKLFFMAVVRICSKSKNKTKVIGCQIRLPLTYTYILI